MKKTLGFTSFEFYFVMSVIGIIVLIATQRYLQLAEDTKRISFEVIAKNFSAAVYSHHARWIMAQSQTSTRQLHLDGLDILFSAEGWPLAIVRGEPLSPEVSTISCLSLWNKLLQNPPSISSDGHDPYGSYTYRLSLPQAGTCRFELASEPPGEFYFEYVPLSGIFIFHLSPITKNN
jgi:hypothetical protein